MRKTLAKYILIVDDLPESQAKIREILAEKGYSTVTATGVFDAISVLDSKTIDLVVVGNDTFIEYSSYYERICI